MIALLSFFLTLFASPFKSKSRLEAENAALRHQLIVLQRRVSGRVQLTNWDRLFLVILYRWFPSVLKVITIIRPETLVRWHRAGFRRYWRWKSRSLGGRPQIDADLRALIRRMSVDNPLWGAPRIHGELLKLGFEVSQSSVAKYKVKRCGPPSQGWRTFLRAAFSASSRLFDLNGEANRVSNKLSRAIIAADVRRFGQVINRDEVFGTHSGVYRRMDEGCGAGGHFTRR
jgi:hypothetical protein